MSETQTMPPKTIEEAFGSFRSGVKSELNDGVWAMIAAAYYLGAIAAARIIQDAADQMAAADAVLLGSCRQAEAAAAIAADLPDEEGGVN